MSRRSPQSANPPARTRALGRRAGLAGLVLAALALLAFDGGLLRPPYPPLGRDLAWWIGDPAPAYNFAAVVPGRIYRSGRPDDALVRHVRSSRGVTRLVSLSGPVPAHDTARALGMEVDVFAWSGRQLPPEHELEAVLDLLDAGGPVWIHCEHGMDRTGLAIAAYRVRRQHWDVERALAEMARYRHTPGEHAVLEPALRALLRDS